MFDIKLDKDTKQKIMLAVIFYFVVIVMLNNIFFTEIVEDINRSKQQLNTTKQMYATNLRKANEVSKIRDELIEARDNYYKVKEDFATLADRRFLVDDITERARKWGINLRSLNFRETVNEGYYSFNVSIKLTAEYQELINFLYSLKVMKNRIKIEDISITNQNNVLNVQLSLDIIILDEV